MKAFFFLMKTILIILAYWIQINFKIKIKFIFKVYSNTRLNLNM